MIIVNENLDKPTTPVIAHLNMNEDREVTS